MCNWKPVLMILFGILAPVVVIAHGEDKPGPHGGIIRMPGAFHTELLKTGESRFKVYLLDIEWKDPLTKNSSVSAIFKSNNKAEQKLNCKARKAVKDAFHCDLPKNWKWSDLSEIGILATRNGASGGVAIYRIPLR